METIEAIQNKMTTLTSWINEMTAINENPYSAGLNVGKMLQDLKGFAEDLNRDIEILVTTMDNKKPEEDKKAK